MAVICIAYSVVAITEYRLTIRLLMSSNLHYTVCWFTAPFAMQEPTITTVTVNQLKLSNKNRFILSYYHVYRKLFRKTGTVRDSCNLYDDDCGPQKSEQAPKIQMK